eukprot:2982956-Rhodomonas_salina.1
MPALLVQSEQQRNAQPVSRLQALQAPPKSLKGQQLTELVPPSELSFKQAPTPLPHEPLAKR